MKAISTPNAPAPAGHYVQAISHDGLIYVSGQLPIDADTGEKKLGNIEEQTRQVIDNISAILASENSSLDQVLKATVFVSDITLWDRVNKVFSLCFQDHKPARVVVPTRELHFGFKIEMDVIAITERGD